MNRRITTKNWKKKVIFHLNALKHLSSYKNLKRKKKTNKFKQLRNKKMKKLTNKVYHLNALKHLYSLKRLKNTKKIKKFKTILIDIVMNTILESRKYQERLQKLNQEIIEIKTTKLILENPYYKKK